MTQQQTGSREDTEWEPSLAGRQLGVRLEGARKRAKLTQEGVAKSLKFHRTKVWRIEGAKTPVRLTDVMAMCSLYGVTKAEEDELLRLHNASEAKDGWIEGYRSVVPSTLGTYVQLEGIASSIVTYSPELVHATLQTSQYAREVISSIRGLAADVIEKRLAFRLERQSQILNRSDSPEMHFVIGQVALLAQTRDPDVMHQQIAHLVNLGKTLDIRIRPFSAGFHPWMAGGGFDVLTFPGPDRPVVYTETHIDGRYMESDQQLAEYAEIFGQLHQSSIPIEEFV